MREKEREKEKKRENERKREKRKERKREREKRERERKGEKRRQNYVQGQLLSIFIQFSKRKTKYIGRYAQNFKKWRTMHNRPPSL